MSERVDAGAGLVVAAATAPALPSASPRGREGVPAAMPCSPLARSLGVAFSPAEWLVAALFFAASLVPSLYPRPSMSQGVLSGLAVVAGSAIGRGSAAAVRKATVTALPAAAARSAANAALGVLAAAVAVWGVWLNYRWQVDVREIMAIESSATAYLASTLPVAAVAAYVSLLVVRVVRALFRGYRGIVASMVPRRARGFAHGVIAGFSLVLVMDVVLAGQVVAAVNHSLIAADASSDAGVTPPDSPYRSGSPASLVAWDTLGRMGRRFVATAPSVDALSLFNGVPAVPPIRVYAGTASAGSVPERVNLAMAELERTGAFERDVLVMITPTGTGSVNRYALAPLEYMYNGNTAAVAVQYSYLPSWVVMGGNQDRAADSARALFDAIVVRLRQEPPRTRPSLVLYGESLGSFASEQIFTDVDDIDEPVDGVLWVGPTRANPLWRETTALRDTGTPEWLPVYEDGETVRFGADGADLAEPDSPWTAPRVAYLQHTSDPVTWWTPDLLLERPRWLSERRPPGISTRMPYVPVVTFVQTTIDTALGGGAPMHHGHIYGTEQAEAWSLIAPPDGWSTADTLRLVARLRE